MNLIRDATAADCMSLTALSIQVWLHTYATDGVSDDLAREVLSTFTPAYFHDLIGDPDYRLFVDVNEENLLGYILLDLDSPCAAENYGGVEVDTLYVQEHFHGRGIGRALLDHAVRDVGARLWLTAWAGNARALGFYKTYGFADIGMTWHEFEEQKYENRILALQAS
ncbi:GNAT family N-acetyltransferase [Collimonas humicola]|uniref:GNAT family N-acetyltransferase n=1 Tax=Collimonas humicola TaxID=2825886 RepID=UPI001B8B76D3|nr:N-acetyltransferase [Collimonas humicola]